MMAGVAILAGIGLAALIVRRHAAIQLAVTAIVASIVAVDLWARAPESVVEIPHSTALATLRDQPDGPRSTTSRRGFSRGESRRPASGRSSTRRRSLTRAAPRSSQLMLFQLNDYKDCANLARLREIGVRYVVSDGTAPMFPGCPGRARELDLLAQDEFFRVERLREMR